MRQVELCIKNGYSLLIEDLGESINPSLDTVLNKNYVEHGVNSYIIKLND